MTLFDDDVILIAGGTGRVGGATVTTLVREGARVALLSRDEHRARAVLGAAGADVARSVALGADLGDPAATGSAVGATVERFGRLDAVVNLAGRGTWGALVDSSPVDLRANLDAFVTTAYNLSVPAVRAMLRQPFREGARSRGRIVTVTAGSSKDPAPERGLFGTAKAAVNTLMLAISREHKADGIVANALVLGGVALEATRAYYTDDEFRAAASPQEVADVLAFLASDRASGVNGVLLDLNARETD